MLTDPHALAADFDLRALPASFYDDPYPAYAALRARDPVRRMPDGSYFLTRYADIAAVYRDAATFSSDKKLEYAPKYGASPLFEHHTTSLVFNDPPLHTRVRRLIVGALTVRAIAAMEPALTRLVDGLLDFAEAKGTVDLIEDFAAAIPVEVIGNLLDVPHADRAPLRGWSLAILGALEPALTDAQQARGNQAVAAFLDYLRGLIADRRRRPGDPAKDVLTRLIQGEADGERLTEAELLHNCIFILNAGHETTTNLIGNGLHALSEWSEQRALLIADPSLARTAVEEMLRFESSNQLGNRVAVADTAIAGVRMPTGTQVTLCIGAANRDPAMFADPGPLRHRRATPTAISASASACTSASASAWRGWKVAVAVSRFVARFPRYRLDDAPVRGRRARFRGFLSVPVRVQ